MLIHRAGSLSHFALIIPIVVCTSCSGSSRAVPQPQGFITDPSDIPFETLVQQQFPLGMRVADAKKMLSDQHFSCDDIPQDDEKQILFCERTISKNIWVGSRYVVRIEQGGEQIVNTTGQVYGLGL